MKNFSLILITIFGLLQQGCGKNNKDHPPIIGSAVSITVDDKQAQMVPSTQALDEISYTLANILKLQLAEVNQQEANTVSTSTGYCDITGLKRWESATLFTIKYKACQNEKYLQDGELKLSYDKTEEAWLYPQSLKLEVKKDYTFNDTILEKNLLIDSHINYTTDMHIKSISFHVTGLIAFNYQTIKLENYSSTIDF